MAKVRLLQTSDVGSKMPSTSQARIHWIDEYKGFILLLVCLFHVEQSFKSIDMGMLHLSAFRMSAFFFISGALFSTRRFANFKDYFTHKTKVLFLPYVFLSLIFLALDPVLYNFDLFPKAPKMVVLNTYPVIHDVGDYIYWNLAKIFIAGKSSIGSGPIWFVFTLYSISLMFFAIYKLAEFCNTRLSAKLHTNTSFIQKIIVAVISCASLAAGWFLYRNHLRLPFGIERDLTTLFFFSFGWLSKSLIQKASQKATENANIKSAVITLAISILSFTLYAFLEKPDPCFSIMNNDLGKSFITFIASSFFGITGIVSAFIFISQSNFINKCAAPLLGIFRNISRNALIILAVHWWILLVLRLTAKPWLDKPGIAYLSIVIITAGLMVAIPLFRTRLYKVIGKEPITIRESLSIK